MKVYCTLFVRYLAVRLFARSRLFTSRHLLNVFTSLLCMVRHPSLVFTSYYTWCNVLALLFCPCEWILIIVYLTSSSKYMEICVRVLFCNLTKTSYKSPFVCLSPAKGWKWKRYDGMWSEMGFSVGGWLVGVRGSESGKRENMLFGGAGGIRSLFQGHLPGGATVWLCNVLVDSWWRGLGWRCSFHTKKLCSRLYSIELEFYSQKNDKFSRSCYYRLQLWRFRRSLHSDLSTIHSSTPLWIHRLITATLFLLVHQEHNGCFSSWQWKFTDVWTAAHHRPMSDYCVPVAGADTAASAFRQPSTTCSTSLPAQHLRPSGLFSCRPHMLSGTLFRISSWTRPSLQTVSDIILKRICSLNARFSALESIDDNRAI